MFTTWSVCLKFARETQFGGSLFRVCQQRMTAEPRTHFSWRRACHVGMAWACKNGWDSNCGDGAATAAASSGGLTDCHLCVSADLCASRSIALLDARKWGFKMINHQSNNIVKQMFTWNWAHFAARCVPGLSKPLLASSTVPSAWRWTSQKYLTTYVSKVDMLWRRDIIINL